MLSLVEATGLLIAGSLVRTQLWLAILVICIILSPMNNAQHSSVVERRDC